MGWIIPSVANTDAYDRRFQRFWLGALCDMVPVPRAKCNNAQNSWKTGLWWPKFARRTELHLLNDDPYRPTRYALSANEFEPSYVSVLTTLGINPKAFWIFRRNTILAHIVLLLAFGAQLRQSAAAETAIIPVPKNIIYAGQVISRELLMSRRVRVKYLKRVSVVTNQVAVIGKVARTTLMPNQPIFTNRVSEPDVIKINELAIMEFTTGLLKITAEVIPLNSAKKGEFVRARNAHSGTIVSGTAIGPGIIVAGIPK